MFPQSSSHLLDLLEQNPANLRGIGDIDPERLLLPDALGFAIGDDGTIVDTVR